MPAAQQKQGDAGALGGELQAATRHHREPPDFADRRGEARHAQPLFERPQHLLVARRGDQHEAGRVEPVRGEARTVQIRPLLAPQHRPTPQPRQNPGDKPASNGAVLLVAANPEEFVQRPEREAAAGQRGVDRGDTEWQHAVPDRPLQPGDPVAQRVEGGGAGGHVVETPSNR